MLADSDATDRERRWVSQLGKRAVTAISDCEIVTVARVHGHAIGGGALLGAACDFRLVSDDAQFAIPEVDLGLPLTWGGAPLLIRELGAARARELIVMAESIDAAEALRIGLAHRVVAAPELDALVDAWAHRIAAKPDFAVHATKTQFRAYARGALFGDVTETDGDMLSEASRSQMAKASFPAGADGGASDDG